MCAMWRQLMFVIRGLSPNTPQVWATDSCIRGPQRIYDATLMLDDEDSDWADLGEAIPLA